MSNQPKRLTYSAGTHRLGETDFHDMTGVVVALDADQTVDVQLHDLAQTRRWFSEHKVEFNPSQGVGHQLLTSDDEPLTSHAVINGLDVTVSVAIELGGQ